MPPQNPVGQSVINEILYARTHADIARNYIFPLPAQVGGHLTVYQTAAELAQGYATLAKSNAQKGHIAFHARILAVELPRNNRFRIWVDWLYSDQHGNPCTGDRSVYFCSLLRGHPAVEMIQCYPQDDPMQDSKQAKKSATA